MDELTDEEKTDIALVIPAKINDTPVVAINEYAFTYYYNYIATSGLSGYTITSLEFEAESNLTSIGKYAF